MIKKAVITAAGHGTRQYPATNTVQKELFPLVDRDGIAKPTIQIIVEEALNAGIEEIALIVQPGMEEQFQSHFQGLSDSDIHSFENKKWGLKQSALLEKMKHSITYLHQTVQDGYGHAVYCAKDWVGNDSFLLMLGDHIYISDNDKSCAAQVIAGYNVFKKSIYAVRRTPAELIYLFGTVIGPLLRNDPPAYELTGIVEKPSVSYAREKLSVPGLPADTFLCFFGMHILTPAIFQILEEHIKNNIRENGEIQLTTAQAELSKREGAIGLEIAGQRLDMGTPLGYIETQLALALNGPFAHDVDVTFNKLKNLKIH